MYNKISEYSYLLNVSVYYSLITFTNFKKTRPEYTAIKILVTD
jgi:hypothetical protein